MFEWETGLTKNPVSKVRLPSCSPSRQRRITSKEIFELVAAHSPRSKVPLKELILFALETGMRRSEILSIRPELVDLDKAVICLPTSKSGTPRQVPLSAKAIKTLKKLDCSFATTSSALGQAWRRAAKKAELKDMRFHDLRHEAISRFF
jgi:integrase